MDRIARIIAVLLTGAAVAVGLTLRSEPPTPGRSVAFDDVPMVVGPWSGTDLSVSPETLEQLGSDALLLRSYRRDDEPPVWLYVDYHRVQRLGSTVHSPRICYPGSGWSVQGTHVETLREGGGEPTRWLSLRRGEERMLAVYWYESRWGASARETTLKLNIARSAMARRASDVVLIRVSTPVTGDDEAAAGARLRALIEEVGGSVYAALPFGGFPS